VPAGATSPCQVLASKHPNFAVGDYLSGPTGVQDYSLSDGKGFSKIDPRDLMGILTKVYSALGLPPSTVEARRAPVRSHDRPFGPKTLSLKGSGSNGG